LASRSEARWILAFDASCGRCGEIARAAAQVAENKLEVLPLTHPEVQQWRRQALVF
jgi:hypothetical protein